MSDQPQPEGSVSITNPSAILIFHWTAQKRALELELKTGMRHSKGSVLQAVNRQHKTSFRRKRQAISYLDDKIAKAQAALQYP